MGHETVLVSGTYREQVIKELIERSARRSEYGHGANGVREKNITFNSLDEAYAYVEEQISDYYDMGILVKAKTFKKKPKIPANIQKLAEQMKKYYKLYNDLNRAAAFKGVTQKTVGCKQCKMRIDVAFLNRQYRPNNCPNCGYDLRSNTVKEKIAGYYKKYEEYQLKYEAELKAFYASKMTPSNTQIIYIAACDVHV